MNQFDTVSQFSKMLRNLDRWLEKAVAYGETKKFDVDSLANARLAPDQYPLARQIQGCCDQAKFCSAYLAGKQAPSNPDTEKTVAELRARIATTIGYLETFSAGDFEGADARKVAPAWMKGAWLSGSDYLQQLAIPNFYFHVTTAYAILRHNSVDLGKMDFVGTLPLKQP